MAAEVLEFPKKDPPEQIYDREPDQCADEDCKSTGVMDLVVVDIDGREAEAWQCNACGHTHVKRWLKKHRGP
jgi:Ser-tRNA(Ala) deacylase AlaX